MKNRTDYSKKYNHNDYAPEPEVKIEEDIIESESTDPKFVKVTVERLNLRPYNSTNGEPITELTKGAELMVTDEIDGWYYVVTPSGAEGYVMKEYVE